MLHSDQPHRQRARPLRNSGAALWLIAALLLPLGGWAKPLPLPQEAVSIHVQDQPLRQFLQDFFAAVGVPVLLSEGIGGNISGQFNAAPAAIFADVTRAYGLVPYYDGTALHLAVTEDLHSETLRVEPLHIDRIVQSVVARELVDDHQTIQVQSDTGVLQVRGVPQFVADVRALVEASAPKPKSRPAPAGPPSASPISQALVFRTFDLKFASAADVTFFQNGREVVIPGVATLLRNMVGDGHSPSAVGRIYGRPADSTVPKLRGKGLRRYSVSHGAQQNAAEPDSALIGAATDRTSRVRIEAEPNLNAVVIRDYADAMPLYAELIERLDVEPNLVEIKVTIIDVDKNKLRDLGVNWRYDSDDTSAVFGGGQVLRQDGGLLLNTVLGNARKFFANINALTEQGSAHVVSRPQIVTVSNLEAVLSSDQTFFVRVAGDEEVDLFDVSVGTSLRVLPNVVGDRDDPKIRLLVTIEDGSINDQATVDDIPVIERSSLTTQAIIFDGESLLIGGLEREDTRTSTTGVPVLSKVPAVGRLFRRDTNVRIDSERLFLISPRIITPGRTQPAPQPSATAVAHRQQAVAAPLYRAPTVGATDTYLDGF